MYWYISFLRPPPTSVSLPSEGITIAPQVANDLRTETRYAPTELYYAWQRTFPTLDAPLPSEHLTTYTPYKPITVPLPPIAAGDKWRLGLFPSPSSAPYSLLQLSGEASAVEVLGVWSEPIEVRLGESSRSSLAGPIRRLEQRLQTARGAGSLVKDKERRNKGSGNGNGNGNGNGSGSTQDKEERKGKGRVKDKDKAKAKDGNQGEKQSRIWREWRLDGPDGHRRPGQAEVAPAGQAEVAPEGQAGERGDGVLRIVEHTSFDLDKKVWDSGLALSSWLWRYLVHAPAHPGLGTAAPGQAVLDMLRLGADLDLDILELGSGTGLVSIALALALARCTRAQPHAVHITATDLPSAISLMEENIVANRLDLAFAATSPSLPLPLPPPRSPSPSPSPTIPTPTLHTAAVDGAADLSSLENQRDHRGRVPDHRVTVRARVLDWDAPLPPWVSRGAEHGRTDQWPRLIVAADVTYNTASFPSLLSTLTALLRPPLPGASSGPSVLQERPYLLLAYKQRDAAERELWGMLEAQEIGMELVSRVQGAEEDGEVEIWVGRAR